MLYVVMPNSSEGGKTYYETIETVLRAFVQGRFAWGLDRYKGDVIERAWVLESTNNEALDKALTNAAGLGWFKVVPTYSLEYAESLLSDIKMRKVETEDTGLADAIIDAREGAK